MGGCLPLMEETTIQKRPKISIDINDIFHVGKWKRLRPLLVAMIGKPVAVKSYGRNERIIIYKATSGHIGTMKALPNCPTVEATTQFLKSFDEIELS